MPVGLRFRFISFYHLINILYNNFLFFANKPITGIEPVFEPWQGPVFTTIRHRQKLGYYAHLPRHIFAPCQAESILATYSRGRVFTIPLDWFACPTTSYSHYTSVRRSEDLRFGISFRLFR